jgi:hypothetical protein
MAVLTVMGSFVLLALLVLFSLSSNVGALGFAGVGGLYIEVDTAVGNNIEAYPTPTETAACYSNTSSKKVGSQDEVAAGALKIDVSQLRIPADKQLRITKDIRTPEILDIGVVRIRLERTGLETNPTYPPAAELPASEGTVPGSYVGGIDFAGINSGTGVNDGYADLTFLRSRNVTSGETNINLTVSAKAEYDFSEVSTRPYTFTRGSNPNRYIDDVTLQGLSNTNTGDDNGYGVYTDLNNSPDTVPTGGATLSVDATAEGATYSDAPTEPPYGIPDGRNDGSYQIDDVWVNASGFSEISNTGTNGDLGYGDYTNFHTGRISRNENVEVHVRGDKFTTAFGWSNAPSGYGGSGDSNNNACATGAFTDDDCASVLDVELNGIDRNSGDDNGYYPDSPPPQQTTTPLEPGETVELTAEFQASDDGQTFTEDTTISIAKAWIDWDQSGSMEEDETYFLGGVSAKGGSTNSNRNTISIFVPKDANYGSTRLRVVNAMCKECNSAPDSNYPADATAGSYNIDHIEKEDYTVDVTPRNQVVAWADWDQDGELSSEERIDVGTSLDKTGRYDYTTTFTPPDDSLSGSTILRIEQYNGRESPDPDFGCTSTGCNAYDGTAEDYTFELAQNLNSATHAFVDWNQNGEFDLTVQEQEDFAFDFLSGWTVNGDAGTATDISNSDSYSVNISTSSTNNQLVSPSVDTSNSGAVNLEFWIARGSDSINNLPEGGENIVVEYKNVVGTWKEIKTIRAYDYEPEGSRTVDLDISDPDAMHGDFQVRFTGNGVGSSGFDYWSVDDPKISTTQEAQRIGTSTLNSGEYSVSNLLDVPPDAKAGSTLMRVVHQQDGYTGNYPSYSSPPGTGFQGEAEDYTLRVERDTSFVRAWIDWNRDGDFDFDSNEEYFVGKQDSPGNEDGFTVSTTVDAPSFSGSGAAVMRVKHEQQQRQTDLTDWDVDGFRGENEDYTVILSQTPGDISETGNLTLGDSSLVLTNLSAENIGLTTTLIDEDYSDNTPQNPTFGPDSSFVFSGDKLELTNATGVLHQANLGIFNINGIKLDVEYNPPNTRNKTSNACPIKGYQP